MRLPTKIALFLVCCSIDCGVAQTPVRPRPAPLELRLQQEVVQKDIPQGFTVVMLNTSNHDIRLPIPSLECGDVPHGTVSLQLAFTPLKPGASASGSGGCVKDFGYQPISERLREWKLLAPGQSLTLATISDRALAKEAGSYDYWVIYFPPGMPDSDRTLLLKAGINFPQTELKSAHVRFVKRR